MASDLPRYNGQKMPDGSTVAAPRDNRYFTPGETPAPSAGNTGAIRPTKFGVPQPSPGPQPPTTPGLEREDSSNVPQQRPDKQSQAKSNTLLPLPMSPNRSASPIAPNQTAHSQYQTQVPVDDSTVQSIESDGIQTRSGKTLANKLSPRLKSRQKEIDRVLNTEPFLETVDGKEQEVTDHYAILQISRFDENFEDDEDEDLAYNKPEHINIKERDENYKKIKNKINPDHQQQDPEWSKKAKQAMKLVNEAYEYFRSASLDESDLDMQEEFAPSHTEVNKAAKKMRFEKNPSEDQIAMWQSDEITHLMLKLQELPKPSLSNEYKQLANLNEKIGDISSKSGKSRISGQFDLKFLSGQYQEFQRILADFAKPKAVQEFTDHSHKQKLREIVTKLEQKVNEYKYPIQWKLDWFEDHPNGCGGHTFTAAMDDTIDEGDYISRGPQAFSQEPSNSIESRSATQVPEESIFMQTTVAAPTPEIAVPSQSLQGGLEAVPSMPMFKEGFTEDGLEIFAWRKSGGHTHQFLVQDGTKEKPHYSLMNSSLCGGFPIVSRNTEGSSVPRLGAGEDNLIKMEREKSTFNGIWAVAEETLKSATPKRKPVTFCLATFDQRPPYWISRTNLGLIYKSKIAADKAIDMCKRRPHVWLEKDSEGGLRMIPTGALNV